MATLLRLSDDATLFEVRYVGEINRDVRLRTVQALEQRLRDGWIKQLLIDFSCAIPTDAVDDAHLDAVRDAWEHTRFPRGARVALLNPPEDYAAPMEQAGATNHFMIRRFHDRRHALAWLKGAL